MALKIRLRQQGRNNRPFYRVVVADIRSPRDGKYVEALGWYNPFETEQEKSLSLDVARIQHWLSQGAQLSERVESLIKNAEPTVVRKLTEKKIAHRAKAAAKRKTGEKKVAKKAVKAAPKKR